MHQGSDPFTWVTFRGTKKKYFVKNLGRPRFNEIDNYGVVWNGHYINYFETARHALCHHFDFDMERLAKVGIFLVVSSIDIKIKRPILPSDEVKVAVQLSMIEESRSEFQHLILVDGEVRAHGTIQHVAMDKATGTIAYQLSAEAMGILQPLVKAFQ